MRARGGWGFTVSPPPAPRFPFREEVVKMNTAGVSRGGGGKEASSVELWQVQQGEYSVVSCGVEILQGEDGWFLWHSKQILRKRAIRVLAIFCYYYCCFCVQVNSLYRDAILLWSVSVFFLCNANDYKQQ